MNLLLTFLLGFPYEEEAQDTVHFDDNVGSKGKDKRNSVNTTIQFDKAIDNRIVIPITSAKRVCKIQYSLPSKDDRNKSILVTYYGTCAEILFSNVLTVVKCKVVQDVAFVPFTIMHHVDTKDLNAPVQIRSQDITVEFRANKDVSNAKGKAQGKIYYNHFDVENDDIGYLVEMKNGEIPSRNERLNQKVGKNDYFFFRPCKFHSKNTSILINKTIAQIKQRKEKKAMRRCPWDLSDSSTDQMMVKDNRAGTAKSGKSQKSEKPADLVLSIKGRNILYEKSVWTFGNLSESLDKDLIYAGLMLTNTAVFTSEQRNHFKSLSIYIKSIRNIPPSVTQKYGVDKIYLDYTFQPICNDEIVEPVKLRNLSKTKIKDVRVFFNDSLPDDKIIEALQSNLMIIKLLGRREKVENKVVPKVWGQDLSSNQFTKRFQEFIDPDDIPKENEEPKKQSKAEDSRSSKRSSKKSKKAPSVVLNDFLDDINEETIILGYSVVSLNDLMKYSFRMTVLAPILSIYLPTSNEIRTPLRPMNVMHFNRDFRPVQKGVISATDFIDNKTSIKIEIKLGYDLSKNVLHHVLAHPDRFTICIFIDYDTKSSYNLLKKILHHNRSFLKEGKNIPNMLLQNLGLSPEVRQVKHVAERKETLEKLDLKERRDNYLEDQSYFTGFMIDCIDFSIIMIESLEIQAIPNVMVHRYQMSPEEGRMLYNSNLVFTSRLYDEFVKFGGMFVSALGLPMQSVLNHSRVHEYVPTPALRCLETLKAITKAESIRRSLLPTPLELLSMDIEFGVPLHKVETFFK